MFHLRLVRKAAEANAVLAGPRGDHVLREHRGGGGGGRGLNMRENKNYFSGNKGKISILNYKVRDEGKLVVGCGGCGKGCGGRLLVCRRCGRCGHRGVVSAAPSTSASSSQVPRAAVLLHCAIQHLERFKS